MLVLRRVALDPPLLVVLAQVGEPPLTVVGLGPTATADDELVGLVALRDPEERVAVGVALKRSGREESNRPHVKVATKSGNVNLTCHFLAGETNWPVGTRYSETGVNDCFTHDFYGNLVALDSHFEVTPNGAAIMTCS